MVCVSVPGGTTCYPPYDMMRPAEFGDVTIADDALCGATTILLIVAGFGIGYMITDKFVTMLR